MTRHVDRRLRLRRSAALSALILGAASPVFAQDAGVPPADDGATVQEVVVTAQRREENLQEVPVAVTVVGADALADRQVFSSEQLVQLVPSLTLQKGSTNVNSSLNIRGVGTVTFASGAEPAVSTVLDGVVLARPGQSVLDLFDVERIEVLRGPQGTLFGKNASAGVVSIVTARPSATFKAGAEAAYFEGEEYRLRAGVSGPLTDWARASASLFRSGYDGNSVNVFNGDTVNGFDRFGGRAKLELEGPDETRLTLIADYQTSNDDCCGEPLTITASNIFTETVLRPSVAPVQPTGENYDVDLDFGPRTKDTNWGVSAQVDAPFGDHTLTSITAYRGWENTEYRDGDYRSDAPAYVFGAGALANETGVRDVGVLDFGQFTQELRLASPTDQFLEYVVGGFYYTTEQTNFFNRTATRCTASTRAPVTLSFGGAAQTATPCQTGASSYAVAANGTANWRTEFENYAVFGQGTLNFSERLRGILGARYSHDRVTFEHQRVAAPAGPGVQPGIARQGQTEEDGISGRIGLQYDLTDDINAYVNYARGYKGPAFNVFFNLNTQGVPGPGGTTIQVERDTIPLSKEESDSYEIGIKSRLFDRRLILNAAAFLTEFSGFQATTFDVIAGLTISRLINAGEVSTRGVEVDFTAVPIRNLTLSGGAIFQDAKVDNFICPPAAPISCNVNGNALPFAPEFKYNISADYRLETASLPFDVGFNTSYSYQDDTFFDFANNPLLRQDAYGLLDASVSLIDRDDRYRLSLVGRNLTDEYYAVTKVLENPAGFPASFVRNRIPRDAERYFGVVLRANFGG
jgi:iron complex outermembrane receptor protein